MCWLVLCRATAVDQSVAFAERLRRTIEALEIPVAAGTVRVTVSIGVAGLPDADVAEPLALLAAADEALFTAKREGRNRVATKRAAG